MPHDVFRRLREEDPVSWQEMPDGPGFWAVTRHADVVAVLRQPAIFSSWRGGAVLADPPRAFLEKLRENMLNRDPPAHSVLRRMVSKTFSPRRIAALEQRIAEHARALVDRVRDRDGCDFAAEIAAEMPLFVICELLGVPAEDRQELYGWTDRMLRSDVALPERMAAAEAMRSYATDLGRYKAAEPGDDLISDLLNAGLTGGEFQAFVMLLFNAGSETTRSMLCLGLDILLDRPDVLDEMRRDPRKLTLAFEEMLRFEPPIIQVRRTVAADTVLGDRTLREGDKVLVFFPSANRDAEVFTDADRFDPGREPNEHVGFGSGPHFCLGAPLARAECVHVFRELLTLPAIERDGPMVRARTNFMRTVHHLPIRLGRAR